MDATLQSVEGDLCLMTLNGEVNQRQLRKFIDPLAADEVMYAKKIVCDISGISLLDSAGVSWLFVTHKRCREHGGRFVLYAGSELVMNVIKVLRLNLVFDLATDEATARQLAVAPVPAEPRGQVSYPDNAVEPDAEA